LFACQKVVAEYSEYKIRCQLKEIGKYEHFTIIKDLNILKGRMESR